MNATSSRTASRLLPLGLAITLGTIDSAGHARADGNAVREGAGFICSVATGSPDVHVAGRPMVRLGDPVECVPTCEDGSPAVGTVVGGSSSSVFVNGLPAAISGVSELAVPCFGQSFSVSGWPFVNVGQ